MIILGGVLSRHTIDHLADLFVVSSCLGVRLLHESLVWSCGSNRAMDDLSNRKDFDFAQWTV